MNSSTSFTALAGISVPLSFSVYFLEQLGGRFFRRTLHMLFRCDIVRVAILK
ncbi:MAG: hypothetical protein WCS73_03930 [Lentisphaeria bacterium]